MPLGSAKMMLSINLAGPKVFIPIWLLIMNISLLRSHYITVNQNAINAKPSQNRCSDGIGCTPHICMWAHVDFRC